MQAVSILQIPVQTSGEKFIYNGEEITFNELVGRSIKRPKTPLNIIEDFDPPKQDESSVVLVGLNLIPKTNKYKFMFYPKLFKCPFSRMFKYYYNALIGYLNNEQPFTNYLNRFNVNDLEINDINDWRIKYVHNYVTKFYEVNKHIGYDILARIQVWNSRDYIKWFYTMEPKEFQEWYNELSFDDHHKKIYQDPINPKNQPLSLEMCDQCQFPQNVIPRELNETIKDILSYVSGEKYDEHKFFIIFNLIWKMLSNISYIKNESYIKSPCGYHAPTKYPNKEWNLLKRIIISNMK